MSGFGWIIVAVVAGWMLVQRGAMRALRQELDTARRDVYRGQYDVEEKLHRLTKEVTLLRLEQRAHDGALRVGPHATVNEVLALHPRMAVVLGRFHMGRGDGAGAETLAEAADAYSQDLEAVLTAIHEGLEHPDAITGGLPVGEPAPDSFSV